jgi:hypothetical protein
MDATLAPAFAIRRKTKRSLAAALDDLIRTLFDTYRPELHYMRGPGPKWHAKHGVQIGVGTFCRHTRARITVGPVGTAVAVS